MGKYIFGVDIGGTTVKLGLFTAEGELLSDWEIKTRTENRGENILPDVAEAIALKMKEENISKDEVLGVGLTAPGPVLKDGTIKGAVNLGWGTFNLSKTLSDLTGLKVESGNDANVAALGELWKGGGMGYSDIMMVTFGTGLGGGLILNGRIHTGANGAAAEIGHIPFCEPEDEPDTCGCGKRGCLEQYTCANGAVHVAKRYLDEHPDEACGLRNIPNFTSKDIFDLVKAGDKTACKIAEKIYRNIGRGMAMISAVTDVEAFVFGGGMSKTGQMLIDGVRKYYVDYAFPACRNTDFKLATLGNKAGIYGAAKLIIDSED
jgi:glucokinase